MNGHRREDSRSGLRSALSLACRNWLRGSAGGDTPASVADDAHAACPRCAPVAAFRSRFAAALATTPKPPAALASRAMLDGVRERIIDASAGVFGGGLANAARSPVADQPWPNGLLDSPLAAATVAGAASPPPAGTWIQLRHRILHDIGVGETARARRVRWLGLLAAAGIVCGAVLLANATEESPTITFTDLATMPDVEFSIVRYGALR